MARAERMLTDDAIADEVDHLQRADPRTPASSRARCSSSSPTTPSSASGCRSSSNIQHAVRFELADGSRVDAVPEDEERLTRDDVTATVHYLKFPFTPAQRELVGRGSGPARRRPSRVPARCRAHRRAARRAGPRLRGVDAVQIRVTASRSRSAAAAPAAHRRRRVRPPRARGRRPSARRAAARSCPPASRSRSRRATQASCSRAPGLALQHGITCLNTPGLIDPLYRGELKVLLVNTDPTRAVHGRAAATASPSSWCSRSRRSSGVEVDELDATDARHVRLRLDRRFGAGRHADDRTAPVPVRRAGVEPGRRTGLARAGSHGRGARLLHAVHARPLRRHRSSRRWSRSSVAAAVTDTLRIGMLVLGNDYKHPAVVAKEAATLDVLSDGRLEFGLGAGWMTADYTALGSAVRLARHAHRATR